jgi:glycerol kinase
MRWRSHTEQPRPDEIPLTAVIAVQDIDGERLLARGIFTLTRHSHLWWNDDTGEKLHDAIYWWLPETELLAAIDDDLKRAEIRAAAEQRRSRA